MFLLGKILAVVKRGKKRKGKTIWGQKGLHANGMKT
jgi:hypothetical protein